MLPFTKKTADYSFQAILIQEVLARLEANPGCVLAASPSAGKTNMAIEIAKTYLIRFPSARILILTHGQTILRTQFGSRARPHFSHVKFGEIGPGSPDKAQDLQVCVALPHTAIRRALGKFDLVIVDEAHDFYEADMVQQILKDTKPKHQLLLTGSPSCFIKSALFPLVSISLLELFDHGVICSPVFKLATTTYDHTLDDYNENDELRGSAEVTEQGTRTTLELLLVQFYRLLTSVNRTNPTLYSALPDYKIMGAELKKTMVICINQRQAKIVAKFFRTVANVNTALSTSDTDKESLEVDRFTTQDNCKVLVVVRRATLGFNFPKLMNVIDMGGSLNPDTLMQQFCRLVRINPDDSSQKLYLKVVPQTLVHYTASVLDFTMGLALKENYDKYDGNYMNMPFPTEREPRTTSASQEGKPEPRHPGGIFPEARRYPVLPSIPCFTDLMHKDNAILAGVRFTTLKDVKAALYGTNQSWTREKVDALLNDKKFKNINAWVNEDPNSYQFACKQPWYEETVEKYGLRQNTNHTRESVEALLTKQQFKNIGAWQNEDKNSYQFARKQPWYEELCDIYFPNRRRLKRK